MTINNNRFSVLLLEKDVLAYVNAKNKYNEYYEICNTCSPEIRQQYKEKRDYWYKKYIYKMRYLEENYRKTHIYTQYHSQLENGYVPPNVNNYNYELPPLAHAEVVEALPVLPSIPPSAPTMNIEPSAPIEENLHSNDVFRRKRRQRDDNWTPS